MIKATGTIRRIDELGRIVLPMKLRKLLKLEVRDPVEMFVDDNNCVLVKKYTPSCIFCGENNEVATFKGRCVCKFCLQDMKNNK